MTDDQVGGLMLIGLALIFLDPEKASGRIRRRARRWFTSR